MNTTETYQDSRAYPASASDLFSYFLGAIKAVGAETDRSDRELGIVEAHYSLKGPFCSPYSFFGQVRISVFITSNGNDAAEVVIKTYVIYSPLACFRPAAGKAEEVAVRILSRVGDAVALAELGRGKDRERQSEVGENPPVREAGSQVTGKTAR
ncbi:MAG: hypothetical protein ABSE70_05635 [Candidatus Limnocylindrales bacterium]